MIVQIYEIQTPREAEEMIRLGVDHIGSVMLDPFPASRFDLKQTVRTVQQAGFKSSLIPLFNDVDAISRMVEELRPDMLHLCETLGCVEKERDVVFAALDRQRKLRERFPEIELMRSIPIGQSGKADQCGTLKLAALFEPISDWFLTDTILSSDTPDEEKVQPVQGFIGITGVTCDWAVANALVRSSRIPVVLAGGIGPHNVADGIRKVKPAGVDSCTLTNTLDLQNRPIRFQKDLEKVKSMVLAARGNDTANHVASIPQ